MERSGDGYVLSTGKRIYANNGIVGLLYRNPRDIEITEGYDGGVWSNRDNEYVHEDSLTPEEVAEIAEFMIQQWSCVLSAMRASR